MIASDPARQRAKVRTLFARKIHTLRNLLKDNVCKSPTLSLSLYQSTVLVMIRACYVHAPPYVALLAHHVNIRALEQMHHGWIDGRTPSNDGTRGRARGEDERIKAETFILRWLIRERYMMNTV